jgi:hypothetical protein
LLAERSPPLVDGRNDLLIAPQPLGDGIEIDNADAGSMLRGALLPVATSGQRHA